MAAFRDIPLTVRLANLSHNPPFSGTPEVPEAEVIYLKPWFVFDRNELVQPQFGDVVRFLLRATDYTIANFPLGGYILWDDGHLDWCFRWQTVVPWSIDAEGDPVWYYAVCQRWALVDS